MAQALRRPGVGTRWRAATALPAAAALALALLQGGAPDEAPKVAASAERVTPAPASVRAAVGAPPRAGAPAVRAVLDAGEPEAAVELLDRAFTAGGAEALEPLQSALLDHAADLIRRRDQRVIALLEAYLARFYRDGVAWFMLAQARRDAGQLHSAIQAFAQARQSGGLEDVLDTVSLQLNWTISLHVQELEAQQQQAEILSLYDYLAWVEPDNPHHYLALADAYAAAGRYSDALGYLAYIAEDENAGARARERMAELLGD